MKLDEIDLKVLYENFDSEMISKIDNDTVTSIYQYLIDNGVYYAKDLFISSLDLFLLSVDEFIKRFEKLKVELGNDYVDKLGEDISFIEIMYR